MNPVNRSLLPLAVIAALAGGPATAAPADGYLSYTGTAVVRHSDRFLYGERHILRFAEGRLAERTVLYTCRDGAPFARKTVQYVDPTAPDFLLDDPRSGVREGVRSTVRGREVFIREKAAAPERAGPLPARPPKGAVESAGGSLYFSAFGPWTARRPDPAVDGGVPWRKRHHRPPSTARRSRPDPAGSASAWPRRPSSRRGFLRRRLIRLFDA